ncbi:LOW QUALITY PROTEIN: hypothetical protein QTO34_002175 [Cnephaeus nilssonii]|uniref:Uncharacterized protein n=1 Tax=Cnephaeus nilssonii TaxID=3371016 RepID=A0AA40LN12_CNENI|nr:LOW QUALITY PROTEIN: hypothetical protein QTO34_002175 [Eptesicus nilssonii]
MDLEPNLWTAFTCQYGFMRTRHLARWHGACGHNNRTCQETVPEIGAEPPSNLGDPVRGCQRKHRRPCVQERDPKSIWLQPSLLVPTTFVPGFQAKWVCMETGLFLTCVWELITGTFLATPPSSDWRLLAEEGPEGPTENLWVRFQEQRQNKEAAELLAATRWQSIPRDAVAMLARKDAAHAVPGAGSARVEWGAPGSDDPRGFQCRLFSTTPQALGGTVEATGFGFYFQVSSDGSLYCNLTVLLLGVIRVVSDISINVDPELRA